MQAALIAWITIRLWTHFLAYNPAFLEEHLLNWVPDFADDVQRVARTGFYRALADIVLGVLETDQAFLEDVLDDAA